MAFRNLHQIGAFYRTPRSQNPPICLEAQETMQLVFQMSRNLPWSHGSSMTLRSAMAVELPLFSSDTRSLSTQVKAPAQARQMLESAYAISKLRKKGYSKNLFYKEAMNLYMEINTLMANGDKNSLRKAVTEIMFSELKNEIKQRDSIWSKVFREMVEPVVKIRTL